MEDAMPNDEQKTPEQPDQADDSVMNDEELESVAGGCQWGDTMFPKFPGTEPTIPTLPGPFEVQ
jgi:hypothetical protein